MLTANTLSRAYIKDCQRFPAELEVKVFIPIPIFFSDKLLLNTVSSFHSGPLSLALFLTYPPLGSSKPQRIYQWLLSIQIMLHKSWKEDKHAGSILIISSEVLDKLFQTWYKFDAMTIPGSINLNIAFHTRMLKWIHWRHSSEMSADVYNKREILRAERHGNNNISITQLSKQIGGIFKFPLSVFISLGQAQNRAGNLVSCP